MHLPNMPRAGIKIVQLNYLPQYLEDINFFQTKELLQHYLTMCANINTRYVNTIRPQVPIRHPDLKEI